MQVVHSRKGLRDGPFRHAPVQGCPSRFTIDTHHYVHPEGALLSIILTVAQVLPWARGGSAPHLLGDGLLQGQREECEVPHEHGVLSGIARINEGATGVQKALLEALAYFGSMYSLPLPPADEMDQSHTHKAS